MIYCNNFLSEYESFNPYTQKSKHIKSLKCGHVLEQLRGTWNKCVQWGLKICGFIFRLNALNWMWAWWRGSFSFSSSSIRIYISWVLWHCEASFEKFCTLLGIKGLVLLSRHYKWVFFFFIFHANLREARDSSNSVWVLTISLRSIFFNIFLFAKDSNFSPGLRHIAQRQVP